MIAFLKKEWLEHQRNYKLFLMLIIFALFGFMSPLIAKLTPLIMEIVIDGVDLTTLPEPTALDSWGQFFKNVTQTGLIFLVVLFSGILTSDLSKGTLIILLAKGLPRWCVILAKGLLMISLWTLSLILCFGFAYTYTVFLFPQMSLPHLSFALFCLWLFGILLMSLILITSVIITSNYLVLIVIGLFVAGLLVLNLFPGTLSFNPLSLITQSTAFLTNLEKPSRIFPAVVITIITITISLGGAVLSFNKKQL
ncbi:ABC transporter permease [Streptococcus merionis]|uniref:ABC transporter permease n=1 Tax=Streptococcus merionis TaxID=400065 RepID=UPI0026F027B6|nr:ABC transporter permease [Streptococcus merionis]